MRKKFFTFACIAAVIMVIFGAVFLSSCGNKQWIDTTYRYNKCIIELPNGEIVSGDVQSWTDYDDVDQIQVKVNGITYLVHSSDIVLIAE